MSERRYFVDKLIGPTLHGHGAHAGRACVALTFADAGERYTAAQIVDRLIAHDPSKTGRVCIAGALVPTEWDAELAAAIRNRFRVHAELDGTRALGANVDWLVVMPRLDGKIVDGLQVDEVHIEVDASIDEDALDRHAARWRCEHYFLRPRGPVERAVALIHARPRWRLSPGL